MQRRIRSAVLFSEEGTKTMKIRPDPGINLLLGDDGQTLFFALAGLMDLPLPFPCPIRAEILWGSELIYGVAGWDAATMSIRYIRTPAPKDLPRLAKRFHKQRFRDRREDGQLFDGNKLSGETALLDAFNAFLEDVMTQGADRPLFICNLLERLDNAKDRKAIFQALAATGRQVFIALPQHPA